MQKRFCSCGTSVWVRYFFANMRWMTFFYQGEGNHAGTHVCPGCGNALDIQKLR
jgi:hypothetical protein